LAISVSKLCPPEIFVEGATEKHNFLIIALIKNGAVTNNGLVGKL
jgi:hypothetical protein